MAERTPAKSKVFTRREVEDLIANGRSIVIVNNKVLKVDAWMPYHPGGDIAIRHMIGRDATDEVTGFHSPETIEFAQRYQIGRVEGRWVNFTPPIQDGKFRKLDEECTPGNDDTPSEQSAPSPVTSSSPSPIFEPVEKATSSVRQRTGANIPRSSSTSSVSSVELDDSNTTPKMSVLDARTQREIDLDKAKYPSLEPQVQEDIVQKYRALFKRIEAEGLFQCRYSSYGIECIRYALLFGAFTTCLRAGWYCISAFFLGFLWHQLSFLVHDAAHMGITHDFQIDSTIAMVVASYMGGLSASWWKYNHNVHHVVTNSPEHDPDIEHMPFFAITHRFFDSLYSTFYGFHMKYDAFAKVMLQYQDRLYYLWMCFGRANLYRLSWTYLFGGLGPRKGRAWWHRYFEIAGLAFFWTWYGYGVVYKNVPGGWNKFLFILISHVVPMPLHVQITLSHFAMSTADLGTTESFPQKMLRTTMDVDCPQWLDFFHGGLQFQAIHHLYPRIPRHNLRQTQKLVQEFCNEVDIPYALFGFVEGNQVVVGKLGDVRKQAAILAECQKKMASGEVGTH